MTLLEQEVQLIKHLAWRLTAHTAMDKINPILVPMIIARNSNVKNVHVRKFKT